MAKRVLKEWPGFMGGMTPQRVANHRGAKAPFIARRSLFNMKTIGLSSPYRHAGMTLMETLVSMMIVAIVISATINGYILSTNRADWSSQSLAAHSLALQRLEQVRAATWNTSGETDVDEVTAANFPTVNSVLDLPVSGTNVITATIRTTITTISANPPLKMVRVDCVWPYRNRGLFTNTITTYRAAEQ